MHTNSVRLARSGRVQAKCGSCLAKEQAGILYNTWQLEILVTALHVQCKLHVNPQNNNISISNFKIINILFTSSSMTIGEALLAPERLGLGAMSANSASSASCLGPGEGPLSHKLE